MFITYGKSLCARHEKLKLWKDQLFIGLAKLLPDKISPNQITFGRLILNLFWLPLAILKPQLWLIIFFFIGYFLDLLDGSLARLKNKTTYLGQYLDTFSDRINHISFFILINELAAQPFMVIKIFIIWDSLIALFVIAEFFLKK